MAIGMMLRVICPYCGTLLVDSEKVITSESSVMFICHECKCGEEIRNVDTSEILKEILKKGVDKCATKK